MRQETWPQDLAAYFESFTGKAFEQGSVDCGHFAADAVQILTGVDLFEPFRGKYTTVPGYLKILKRLGHDCVASYVDGVLEAIPVPMAQRGDVVLRLEGELEALGICDGVRSVFLSVEGGLAAVPTMDCQKAWRVS